MVNGSTAWAAGVEDTGRWETRNECFMGVMAYHELQTPGTQEQALDCML